MVLRQPYLRSESFELSGSASIGVSLFPEHGQDTATLQRLADVAMYQCKAQNKDEYAVFDVDVNRLDFRSAQMAGLIREGLDNNYFRLHYQPLKAIDGALVGFEGIGSSGASVFWKYSARRLHTHRGANGSDCPLGKLGAARSLLPDDPLACRHGHVLLRINVNVSTVQLTKANYVEIVKSTLNETGLKPRALTLEITETGFMHNLRGSLSQIEELRAMGVTIALDDFGTGYSTLSSLHSLPVDYIKIDRSFVARLVEKAEFSLDVIEAITTLAHKFGFEIVAEGIEFSEQLDAMKSIGCDVLQGYLLCGPPDDFGGCGSTAEFRCQRVAPVASFRRGAAGERANRSSGTMIGFTAAIALLLAGCICAVTAWLRTRRRAGPKSVRNAMT